MLRIHEAGRTKRAILGDGALPRLRRPFRLAVDRVGKLYVSGRRPTPGITVVLPDGEIQVLEGVSGPLSLDANDRLYVADANRGVVRIDPDGTTTVLAATTPVDGGRSGDPSLPFGAHGLHGIAVSPHGVVYVAEHWRIWRLDSSSAVVVADGTRSLPVREPSFGNITGLACDPSGALYLADFRHGCIRRLTDDGRIEPVTAPRSFDECTDVALDRDGDLIVADSGRATLCRVHARTGTITVIANEDDFSPYDDVDCWSLCAVAVSPTGCIYVADQTRGTVVALEAL